MNRYIKGVLWIITAGMLMSIGVFIKYKKDVQAARRNYIQEEHFKSSAVAAKIDDVFQTIYEGLRVITRLPGVKNIGHDATAFDPDARITVQEIYNNIANKIALSEIYITPLDFNPRLTDERTGKPEEPIVMFDQRITGRTAISGQSPAGGEAEPASVDEIEIYEYLQIEKQLAWMTAYVGHQAGAEESGEPAVSSPEVITCDNTQFNPRHPDDQDRQGIVYSLPLYDHRGQLKGSVSGIILSKILAESLPSQNYFLGSKKYGYLLNEKRIKSSAFRDSQHKIRRFEVDNNFIYSEVLPLDVPDEGNSWYLWAAQTDAAFWGRQDVMIARQFAFLGFAIVFILTGGTILVFFLFCRYSSNLESINRDLQQHQSMLQESKSLLKRFSGAILSVREEEKKKLSHDIHDMVGSMAIGLNTKLKMIEDSIQNDQKTQALSNTQMVKESIRSFVSSFKHIAMNLRPPQIEVVGLARAVEEYCEDIAKNHPLVFDLSLTVDDECLPDDLAIALYRVLQEALNNIIRHSRATNVKIALTHDDAGIELDISDNGIGFDVEDMAQHKPPFKIGIIGMRERIESFNGSITINSEKEAGTQIHTVVPLPEYQDAKG